MSWDPNIIILHVKFLSWNKGQPRNIQVILFWHYNRTVCAFCCCLFVSLVLVFLCPIKNRLCFWTLEIFLNPEILQLRLICVTLKKVTTQILWMVCFCFCFSVLLLFCFLCYFCFVWFFFFREHKHFSAVSWLCFQI